jgi:hypothetical protein
MLIFISSMLMDKTSMVVVFTLFRTIAPERDEIAAKRDVKRIAAAVAGVAACITGSGICIVSRESV